jgi:hypothetical protein
MFLSDHLHFRVCLSFFFFISEPARAGSRSMRCVGEREEQQFGWRRRQRCRGTASICSEDDAVRSVVTVSGGR